MKYDPEALLNRMIGGVIERIAGYQEASYPQNPISPAPTFLPMDALIRELRGYGLPDQVILDKLVELEKGRVYVATLRIPQEGAVK
jgi:hypothetical protein